MKSKIVVQAARVQGRHVPPSLGLPQVCVDEDKLAPSHITASPVLGSARLAIHLASVHLAPVGKVLGGLGGGVVPPTSAA